MLTESELPADPFLRPIGKLPRCEQREVTNLLAPLFGDWKKTYLRVRDAAVRGVIHRRFPPNAKKTSAALFGPDDVATAAVVFSLWDMDAGPQLTQEAALACYHWDRTVNPRPPYIPPGVPPVIAAMRGIEHGEDWAFKLTEYRCQLTSKRLRFATVFNLAIGQLDPVQSLGVAPSFLPRTAITIWLPPLLGPLNRMFDLMRVSAGRPN